MGRSCSKLCHGYNPDDEYKELLAQATTNPFKAIDRKHNSRWSVNRNMNVNVPTVDVTPADNGEKKE